MTPPQAVYRGHFPPLGEFYRIQAPPLSMYDSEDRLVGQAVLVPDGDQHEFAVFLHGPYQGAGIGTRLTEATLSYGREHGVEDIRLLVERSNEPAVRLHWVIGFVVVEAGGHDL